MFTIDFSCLPDENLLIGSLVSKAAEMYSSHGDCGDRCNHPSGYCNESYCKKSNCKNCGMKSVFGEQANCLGCCLECSEEVHFHCSNRQESYRKEYDCQKLAYYYACRYSWKYCSEIMYALESIDLSVYDRFKVLSLGCGAAPDLMAFEQINRKNNLPMHYSGIDANPYWSALHSEIVEYCSNSDISVYFETNDVFDVLDRGLCPQEPYNVVCMQYLISSFPNEHKSQMVNELCDLLINRVISKKRFDEAFLVVLNDIDHHSQARDHFDILFEKIKQAGYHGRIFKAHFKTRGSDYHDGSVQHSIASNKFAIPTDIIHRFNCALQCSSAQMILEVR